MHYTQANGHLGYDHVWDVEEYDARQDSSSGLWRCNDAASWYNESGGPDRSTKACFPEKTYLIATARGLDIIDARTDRMWMRFEIGPGNALTNILASGEEGDPYRATYYDAQVTSVDARDGVVYASISGGLGGRIVAIDFINDRVERWGTDQTAGIYSGGIADRNASAGHSREVVNPYYPGTRWVFDIDVERVQGKLVLAAGVGNQTTIYREGEAGVVADKGPPALPIVWIPSPYSILSDRALRVRDAELETEFVADPVLAHARVLGGDPADEDDVRSRNGRSTRSPLGTRDQRPEPGVSLTPPLEDRVGFDDEQATPPAAPEPRELGPEDPVGGAHADAASTELSLKHDDLVTEDQNLAL